MRIYIAGPMTAFKNNNYNYDEFDRMRNFLLKKGVAPVSPADLNRMHEGWDKYPPKNLKNSPSDRRRFMTRDLLGLMDCSAVVMLKGWELSSGAKCEYYLARSLDIPVLHEDYVYAHNGQGISIAKLLRDQLGAEIDVAKQKGSAKCS